MKKILMACLLPGLLLAAGCSKEPEVTDDYSYEYESAPAAAPAAPPSAGVQNQAIAQHLENIERALESKNYKTVVDRFEVLDRAPKTLEEERAYRQAVFETQERLRQQAEVDPAAEQAYRHFGRRIMGR